MTKTLFIDFDGTIVEHKFPKIGEPLPDAFEVLKELKEAGYKLVLWTCREDDGHKIHGQYLTEAIDFCKMNGIEFDAVNEMIPEDEFRTKDMLKRKPCGLCFIDDLNFGGFPGWKAVREALL